MAYIKDLITDNRNRGEVWCFLPEEREFLIEEALKHSDNCLSREQLEELDDYELDQHIHQLFR